MKKIFLLAATIFCFLNLTNAQPGQLDPSFGINGIVTTDLGKNYNYPSSGSKVLVQSDGSIYLVLETSDQTLITKRHGDGSTDVTYGHNGFSANVKMNQPSAFLQADGKIVVGGSIDKGSENFDLALARFNADGSLDSSFSDDGIVSDLTFYKGMASHDNVAVIQNKGKIVVCSGRYVSRYNSDGNLDSSFNGGRIQTDNFQTNVGAIQSNGKIVVAGNIYSNNGGGDTSVYVAARYNTDGSPDRSFGNNGKQITHLSSLQDFPNSVVIQNDGKILVGGGSLVRYNTDGSLDKSFSGDGIATTDFYINYYSDQGYSIALQSNQKIVVAGNTGDFDNPEYTTVRYNADGSIDNTFSGDGMLSNGFKIASVAISKNGKIIVGGSDNSNFELARYSLNGDPDNSFDKDGKLTGNINSGYTIYKSIAFQKDGKIVTAGRTWNGSNFDFAIARYNTDGSPDNTFNGDGANTTDFTSKDDYANSVAIQADGKIVVAGSSGDEYYGELNNSNISIARYNTDGSLDNTFGSNGKIQTFFKERGDKSTSTASSLSIQKDGKIVVVGGAVVKEELNYEFYMDDLAVLRYNTDGSLDKTFNQDGKKTFEFSDEPGEFFGFASSVAIQKDGKIAVGGTGRGDGTFVFVARLNVDGSFDNTFNDNGRTGQIYVNTDAQFFSVAIQNDGKIVAGGYSFYRGNSENFVDRFNTNGTVDNSFSAQVTELENTHFPTNDFGNVIAIQNDGKIVVSGAAFTRYSANGSLDSSFGTNGIQAEKVSGNDMFINSIAISGNKLYGVGFGKSSGNVGLVARYLLDNSNSTTPPTVSLTAPKNNTTYLAPAAHIRFFAVAADKDGTISKVEFYNGTTLLHTETVFPYGFTWRNVPLGNYTLTAKATDNSGLVTTSAPVHISVVPNKPPVVSITKPNNNQSFAAPGYIHLEAAASDTDGRITNVKFYNGTTLLRTEYEYPYTYHWENVPAGTYTITAVATDNWGAHTTSAPVTIRVTSANAMIVSNKPINNKTGISNEISLKLSPNPATNIVNLYTKGLQQNKPATISIISVSGIVLKTMQTNNSTIQLDVSSLVSGVYTIKIVSGGSIVYKQFVKL